MFGLFWWVMFTVAPMGAILLCQEYLNIYQAGGQRRRGGVEGEKKWSPACPEDTYQGEGASESQAPISCMFI